jgi:hypothetical protein
MSSRFRGRIPPLDEFADEFLKTLAWLGGYCTTEQAQRLGIARSATRVLAHLRRFEHGGFLRKLAVYPGVYQITKSVTRLLEMDLMARRPHPIETVRNRLLAVNFYLEALRWPAAFLLDHEEKVAAFQDCGCPLSALPQRSGQPYLWEEFVLQLKDGGLCAAIVDRCHRKAYPQLWGFAQRFCACQECLGEGLELLVAVGSEARYQLYYRLLAHPGLQKVADGRFEISVSLYQVQKPVPLIRWLSSANGEPYKNTSNGMGGTSGRNGLGVVGSQGQASGLMKSWMANPVVVDPGNS